MTFILYRFGQGFQIIDLRGDVVWSCTEPLSRVFVAENRIWSPTIVSTLVSLASIKPIHTSHLLSVWLCGTLGRSLPTQSMQEFTQLLSRWSIPVDHSRMYAVNFRPELLSRVAVKG